MIGYNVLGFIEKVFKKIMSSTKNKICFISVCAFFICGALTCITIFSVSAATKETGIGGFESPVEPNFSNSFSPNFQNEDILESPVISESPLTYETYRVKKGDMIGFIADKYNVTQDTIISVNSIKQSRLIQVGQYLKIPSIPGIIYTVKKGDSLDSIVKANKIDLESLLDVNELSSETLTAGQQLFLPGASLDSKSLKTAMGDKFIMPIAAKFRWSSPYGARIDPIAGVKSFHTGTDMACPTGTPILASMSGKVIATGENRVYGLYVIIDHGNGYQTLYAHMSKIIATKGKWVSQGTRIGLVGSTGYSTGPHLHFTVYKNGKMINPMSVLK